MERYKMFSHRRIGDAAWIVTERYSPKHCLSIGVIAGLERIGIVNSGCGFGENLRKYIEGFAGTEKPFLCYCTSGKAEHTGGAFLFDEAYAPLADHALNGQTPSWLADVPEKMRSFCSAVRPEPKTAPLLPLCPGFTAIGRQHLMPRPFPGNTKGSFIVLNMEGRLCFLGDAVSSDVTSLTTLDRSGMMEYAKNLRTLAEDFHGELIFYCSSSALPLPKDHLLRVAAACEEIADGKQTGDLPAGNTAMRIHEFESAAILYDAALCG